MVQDLFAGILGQEMAVELLGCALGQQRLAPAYLLAGPSGVGRRLLALRFAEGLLTTVIAEKTVLRRRIEAHNHPDLLWVAPTYLHQGKPITVAAAEELGIRRKSPPQIRLVQIRDITQFLARPPLESSRAVVIIEAAETMAEAAANGLLKTLEEPGQASLLLLAPDSAALLPTLVSRCQQVPCRRLSPEAMEAVLSQAGHPEILQQPNILALAQGSPGQAIAAWQRLQTFPDNLIATLQTPPTTLRQALDLARWISKDLDIEAQLWLVEYLQHYYWQAQHQPTVLTLLEKAHFHLRRFVQPRLVWEVTLMTLVPS